MVQVPRLNAKELAKLVEEQGFSLVRQRGSHRIYKNSVGLRVTIPFHNSKILHPKIIKQTLQILGMYPEK